MELKKIILAIKSDPYLFSALGERIFQKTPVKTPENSYILFSRNPKVRNMVSEKNTIRFFIFSKNAGELETLSNALISFFEGYKNEDFYQTIFISQKDIEEKLDTEFYTSILFFDFYETI